MSQDTPTTPTPTTECCHAEIGAGRYCPKCGWEARTTPAPTLTRLAIGGSVLVTRACPECQGHGYVDCSTCVGQNELLLMLAEKDAKLAELQGEIDNHNCTTHALNLAAKVRDLDMELGRERRASAEKDATIAELRALPDHDFDDDGICRVCQMDACDHSSNISGCRSWADHDALRAELVEARRVSAEKDEHIKACEYVIRIHAEAASCFQPGGEFYGVLKLGGSSVADGIAWLRSRLAGQSAAIARLTEERDMLRAKLDARA